MEVREDNPFRDWLLGDTYSGYWVPVGRLGGWSGAAALPVLFSGDKADVLRAQDWPLQFDSAGPEVWESWDGGTTTRHSALHPCERKGDVTFRPFLALFDPFARPSWLEPIQAFVLHWKLWPKHHPDGSISWFEEGDDSQPDEMARWRIESFEDRITLGRLEIRRDRLLAFLSAFEFDLAIYLQVTIEVDGLDKGWKDSGSSENLSWRCWATELSGSRTVATIRAVHVIERASYSDVAQPWSREERTPNEYPIGVDPRTGKGLTATHPPAAFLTSVFFKEAVLEKYYADPQTYSVEETLVRGGRHWSLPIAKTGRGTLHAWLGDISELPDSVQAHWKQFAVVDQGGIPEWRVRTDFLAQFVEIPSEGPVAELKRAIGDANEATQRRIGQDLFAPIDPMHAESIRVLRIPANDSLTAFLDQVRPLALLVVDHINSDFLAATGITASKEGTLNRLAEVVSVLADKSFDDAKDIIGGLYAVQAVRSNLSAHRTGRKANDTLDRAGISRFDLPAGFEQLVRNAAAAILSIAEIVRDSRRLP